MPVSVAYIYVASLIMIEVAWPSIGINLGNIVAVLASLYIIYLALRWRIFGSIALASQGVVFIFLVMAILYFMSIFWSWDKKSSAIQAIFYFIILLAGIAVSTAGIVNILRAQIVLSFYLAIASFIVIPVAPDIAFQPHSSTGLPELRGVYKHQQRLGLLMSVSFGIFFIFWWKGQLAQLLGRLYKYRYIFCFTLLMCWVAAQARSYAVFAILALVFSLVWSGGVRNRLLISGFTISVLVALFIADWSGLQDDEITLTGRTIVWAISIEEGLNQLPLGYGFGVFDSSALDSLWGVYRPPHAHNSFVNIFFELGIPGILILSMYVVYLTKKLLWSGVSSPSSIVVIFVFVLTFLASQMGVTLGGKPSFLLYFFMLLSLALYQYQPTSDVKIAHRFGKP